MISSNAQSDRVGQTSPIRSGTRHSKNFIDIVKTQGENFKGYLAEVMKSPGFQRYCAESC